MADMLFSAIQQRYIFFCNWQKICTFANQKHAPATIVFAHLVMQNPLITLTTDWGYNDFFSGMVKGRLYSSIPNVQVVDITHGLEPFQLARAIFAVRHACMGFPSGTIHIIDATAAHDDTAPYILVEYLQQYYICADNGLPSAVFSDHPFRAVAIGVVEYNHDDFRTFAAYHIYCPVATQLALGASLSDIGAPIEAFCPYMPIHYIQTSNLLKLYIAYIDSYGNAILNISHQEFENIRAERKFEMQVHEVSLSQVDRAYSAASSAGRGRAALLLTVSATGYLQIAMRQYSAEQYFGLRMHESITVRFF